MSHWQTLYHRFAWRGQLSFKTCQIVLCWYVLLLSRRSEGLPIPLQAMRFAFQGI